VSVWLNDSALLLINEVTLCQARLVLGWVTSSGRQTISLSNQPSRSTQTDIPSFCG